MRLLVVGSGAREHALVWKLASASGVDEIYAAPGNPGIAAVAHCVGIAADNIVELGEFAASLKIDLTVVGPELPLVLGIADDFARRQLTLLGPTRAAAEVEGSKVFTKEFCLRHDIPTAQAHVVQTADEAARAVRDLGVPVVFKADGLASGKGVVVCHDHAAVAAAIDLFFTQRAFGAAGERVVIEECLTGSEVSFMVLTDGSTVAPLASARDYKRLGDGDAGPNTGGMGAVSPAGLDPESAAAILTSIVHPTISGLAAEGREFRGVLYAGVMLTEHGPRLLEYNCRLGDPETQAILARYDGDVLPLLLACARGDLGALRATWRREAAVCVVLAADGYPARPRAGDAISGVGDALAMPGVMVFHSGTAMVDGCLVTAGGRVLSVVARGSDVAAARAQAYTAVAAIDFAGMQLRRDIGGGL